jgi:poly(3-hydroxybutyrate) depolymerase
MNFRITLTIVLVAMAFLAGCSSAAQRFDRRAQRAGLVKIRAESGQFPTLTYVKPASVETASAAGPLLVFLEGDGIPWRNGKQPSVDPTTRNPIALELLLRSPAPAAYVTRPCYHGLLVDKCTAEHWTSARYSTEVVASMTAAVREAHRRSGAREVSLIGYSGGGVLAVLIAERLEHVAAVVTLAANLDTDAWTQHHGYLPLSQSLNPAVSHHEHSWPELHLRGADDAVVPAATTGVYFKRHSAARQQVIAGYDHVCCWSRDWESLLRGDLSFALGATAE